MKYYLIILLSIIFFVGCLNTENDVSVMSFYIKKRDNLEGINSWENRKPILNTLLKQKKPDIIGFQDIDKNQLVALSYDLHDYKYIGDANNSDFNPTIFNPVFFVKEKFDLISWSQFWLSENPDILGSKGWGSDISSAVTWVQLKNKETGHIFYVFNTLFSSDAQKARNESAKLLVKKINTIVGEAPVIITCSLSDTPESKPYRIITSGYKNYVSLWDSEKIAIIKNERMIVTYNGYNDETNLVEDYIFVNGYLNVEKYNNYKIKRKDIFISNHYPVMAYLTFNTSIRERDENKNFQDIDSE
ncbi:MAG: hypothetical protein JW717_10245 [Marinilabiliaceae bacterium]|nr:hypothetical protein [Marinilabiliaceae bacterium]